MKNDEIEVMVSVPDKVEEVCLKLYTDPVTETLNRRYFEEHPDILDGKNAVALFQVDDFDDVIETYGYDAGDKVLKKFAGIVKERIRKDDIFVHYGSATFLLMFGGIVEDSFFEKMNNIRLAAAACRSEQEKLRFTVSVGCVVREDGQTISFDDVDKQLYIARRLNNAVASGNKVLYCEGSSFRSRVHEIGRVFPVAESIDSPQSNKKIINIFVREYTSVYIIDLEEDKIYPRKLSDFDKHEFDGDINNCFDYSGKMRRLIDTYVADVDREWLKLQLLPENLMNKLSKKGDIAYTIRAKTGDDEHFYRLRVASLSEMEIGRFAVLGFTDRNREVIGELMMDRLIGSFNSIIVVDLNQNRIRVFKESLVVPEMNVECKNYTELVKSVVHLVSPEHKKEFYKLSDVAYVKEMFRDIDRREMVFKMQSDTRIWKKVTMSVLERQDGEAVTMSYCFSDMDYYRSKELEYNKLIKEQEETLERIVRERTCELSKTNRQLRKLNEQIVDFMGFIVEGRDFTSGRHIASVKVYTAILASKVKNMLPEYGLTSKDVESIVAASPLHDIGKVAVSDSILLKPGKLTDEEFSIMKKHTLIGYELLKKKLLRIGIPEPRNSALR